MLSFWSNFFKYLNAIRSNVSQDSILQQLNFWQNIVLSAYLLRPIVEIIFAVSPIQICTNMTELLFPNRSFQYLWSVCTKVQSTNIGCNWLIFCWSPATLAEKKVSLWVACAKKIDRHSLGAQELDHWQPWVARAKMGYGGCLKTEGAGFDSSFHLIRASHSTSTMFGVGTFRKTNNWVVTKTLKEI